MPKIEESGCHGCRYGDWDADGCTCKLDGLLVPDPRIGCKYRKADEDKTKMQELIYKQDAHDKLEYMYLLIERDRGQGNEVAKGLRMACKAIGDIKAVDTEPVRHGRWIPIEYDSYADGAPVWDKWECSECGHEHKGEEDTLTAFCPDCGARMDATDTNVGGKGDEEMDLSPLDFLAAEYDRKHPQGIRFVDCMEGADDGACKKV